MTVSSLYSAVSHQLGQHGKEAHSIEYLRRCTADYLKTRKDELIHYFDETITVSEESYLEYTNAIALTAAWGGQIEVGWLWVINWRCYYNTNSIDLK